MVQTSAYDSISGPKTREVLGGEVRNLLRTLQEVHQTAVAKQDLLPSVPSELIQYVEAGRNPDIYTREFVELVRRGNQLMRGRMSAFSSFRDVLAEQIRLGMPELSEEVQRVIDNTGGSQHAPEPGPWPGPDAASQPQQQLQPQPQPQPQPQADAQQPAQGGTAQG